MVCYLMQTSVPEEQGVKLDYVYLRRCSSVTVMVKFEILYIFSAYISDH